VFGYPDETLALVVHILRESSGLPVDTDIPDDVKISRGILIIRFFSQILLISLYY
jgi:hypothetical protein